jgi:hypothetical protein
MLLPTAVVSSSYSGSIKPAKTSIGFTFNLRPIDAAFRAPMLFAPESIRKYSSKFQIGHKVLISGFTPGMQPGHQACRLRGKSSNTSALQPLPGIQ